MNIYIASSHQIASEATKELYNRCKKNGVLKIFFPESLGTLSDSIENMRYIDEICCKQIRESDILVAIYPFGLSVSVEIGRFLERKNMSQNNKKLLIILDISAENSKEKEKLKTEAMIIPHIDYYVHSVNELIETLSTIDMNCWDSV